MAKSISTHRASDRFAAPDPQQAEAAQRAALVQTLGEQLRQIESARFTASAEIVSSGHAALDRLLPEGGFRRGSLVEWLAGPAGGAATLALASARGALESGGALVIVDRPRRFYPPAAVQLGIPLEKILVVRPTSDADQAWALDQVLRSRGVAAVWATVDRAEDSTLRRWQLAAENSGALGFLLRTQRARAEPSWAEVRLGVEPVAAGKRTRGRRLRVELLRSRLGRSGAAIEWELSLPATWLGDHETHAKTHSVPLASPMAAAKARRRPRRA